MIQKLFLQVFPLASSTIGEVNILSKYARKKHLNNFQTLVKTTLEGKYLTSDKMLRDE